ncbi:hypothetical protein A3H53_04115 [Candidatus Nomurabacteria bacterium RIFCSPLOWO2_02_FULL_40_10]|uniref:Peptidoglycan binding-like domain-containing protein n=2 Tax=Candidatus Nomuraibacteriota TaxID=1752729 RepID=A0A1F6Y0Y1_9BACT|nr:MAG: hypothetical protein A2642_04015 [Candidatus Nomurabacteria bacterium RIFCSPHIGHO2_01_FULL_39_10]OGJ00038.1 MAG: hypothetical protein A3H53_04115 [Candidatus Nomurabacteria bacterium RIFCSPLOWO2_02_FULL_40_10]
MEKLKFALFAIVTLGLLGIFGYWAVTTIQSGTEHAKEQKIETLEKENAELKKDLEKLTSEFGTAQAKIKELTPEVKKEPEVVVYKHQSLIDELQKLIDGKTLLKQKSSGPKVGTVQKFLNIYNDTTKKVDNSYGIGTAKVVSDFQKDVGLNPNGESGSSTFVKMIEWLKKQ